MKFSVRRHLALLCCLYMAANIYAYNLRQLSNIDGLSNSAVLSLHQDNEGLLWLGTCDGLNLYDGIDIRPITLSDDSNLSGNIIENILETEDGILWIQTNYGLDRLDKYRRSVTSYTQFQGSYLLKKNAKKDIFILSENNLLYYKPHASDNFHQLPIPRLTRDDIIDIQPGTDCVWFFTQQGILQFSLEQADGGYVLRKGVNVDDTPWLHCFTQENTTYLIDRQHTLYRYEAEHNRKIRLTNLDKEITERGSVSDIIGNGHVLFIAFKTNGVLRLTPQNGDYQKEDIGIKSGIFRLLKSHNQDIVWIGTDGQGAYLYSNGHYSIQSITYNDLNIGLAKPIRSIFLDRENTLWMGTKGEGILRIRNYDVRSNTWNYHTELVTVSNSRLMDNSVYAFAESSRPLFWIGNDAGINYYSYRNKNIQELSCNEPIKYVHAIHEEHDSILWIATVGTGVIRARIEGSADTPKLTVLQRYTIDNGNFSSNYFFTLYCNEQGELYFGNRGYGTFRLKDNRLESVPLRNHYKDKTANDVFALLKNKETLWIGTGYGLIRRDNETERCFNKANGIPNSTIHAMQQDNSHNIWAATNSGLLRFHPEQNEIQNYNRQNGLNIIEFSDGATFHHPKALFFGGINGLAVIRENAAYHTDTYTPPIRFTRLSISGQEQNLYDYLQDNSNSTPTLTLQYTQNYFRISFIALDYINSNNYTYLYTTDKKGVEWIDNGPSNTISFTRMEPGDYTLYVKYRNRTTGKESDVYSIHIHIQPPWYLSNTAMLVYQVLLLTLIILLIRIYILRQQQKQRQMMQQLEQSHKEELYEEKLRFFTNITHEFCTPLTLIYGPCERILAYDNTDDFIRKYIRLIKQNTERLNALIQEVIDFRRMETGHKTRKIQRLVVSETCNEVIASFSDLAEQNRILLETSVAPDLQWNTDPSCFNKILNNLISNAFKYTPTEGTIRITLTVANNRLLLSIYNTGKGIRQEEKTRIFNRYSILDNIEENAIKGLSSRNGLGMAICHSMVELLEGDIKIESEVNKYAEFIITLPELPLPKNNGTENMGSTETQTNEQAPGQTITTDSLLSFTGISPTSTEQEENADEENKPQILVVDDNAEILSLLYDTLSNQYRVLTARNGEEGMELLRRQLPELIITDIMMPGTDGIELTRQIKQEKHTMHIPLIILSAKNSNEEKIEGLASGADAYIGKPFNLDYLRAIVARLLENKERIKAYYNSSACAYEYADGKLMEKKDRDLLLTAKEFINSHLENPDLTPEDLASHLQISVRGLYRKFKELEQPSPKDFIREHRVTHAARLLRTTTLTVQEIVFRCGYNNRSYFYKEFDKKFGITPREYRAQGENGNS